MKCARGLTLVELLVGLTIGLILLAGASGLMLGQLREHRQLVQETQVQQDVRAIAALLRREVATAGAWGDPAHGAWSSQHGKGRPNPYALVDTSPDGSSLSLAASHSLLQGLGNDNHQLDDEDRKVFRWRAAALEFRTDGGRFQPLNDPASVAIRHFEARVETTRHPQEGLCPKACAGRPQCPPQLVTRTLRVRLTAEAATDPRIQHPLDWRTRLDTDHIEGSCPP